MRLLLIGGTKFVGYHLTEAALARGWHVTHFNRGQSNPGAFPQVETITGDRNKDLDRLDGRWDAVIDTSGYTRLTVAKSAEWLQGRADRYVFISTISVYENLMEEVCDEDSKLATTDDPDATEVTGENYGALKVLCEREVTSRWGEQSLIVRPGLIVGPQDPTDRFPYWLDRVARGGDFLVPGTPGRLCHFSDVRALARWTVDSTEAGRSGVTNIEGRGVTMESVIKACQAATGASGHPVWVDSDWLAEQGVSYWSGIPLWLPENAGHAARQRAAETGLEDWPLDETAADTWAWLQTLPADRTWKAGLAADREAELLAAWGSRV